MEKELTFIFPEENQEKYASELTVLMKAYVSKLDGHQGRITEPQIVDRVVKSMLRMQTDPSRILFLCYDADALIGFCYGKVDRIGHKGLIRPGWGYIMEFYVQPQYRCKGYGTRMYQKLESMLRSKGAISFYLTADPITGAPFWEKMGYINRNTVSPENGLGIYEKGTH